MNKQYRVHLNNLLPRIPEIAIKINETIINIANSVNTSYKTAFNIKDWEKSCLILIEFRNIFLIMIKTNTILYIDQIDIFLIVSPDNKTIFNLFYILQIWQE